jgi:hypothetical protein
MWIFTRDGFYSAVQHRDNPGLVQVRGRVRDDLERLRTRTRSSEIIELDDADYRYRINIDRDAFAQYVLESVLDIDYTTSVKDAISRGDKDRKRAHLRIWEAMYGLQPRSASTDDEWEYVLESDDDWEFTAEEIDRQKHVRNARERSEQK